MRRIVPVLSLSFVAALSACGDAPEPVAPDGSIAALSERVTNRYVVVFTDEVRDVRGVAAELARGNGFGLQRIREHAARGFTAVIPQGKVEAVRSDPRVRAVIPDRVVSLPRPIEVRARPGGGGGGGGETPSWGVSFVGGSAPAPSGRKVYVIDTGVDFDHPDLNVDPSCGDHFTGRNADDGNGHGTHVAGIIGALDNDIGVLGIAAGARICPVRVLGNSGSGSYADVIAGVDFVAGHGANGDVANMSLGGPGDGGLDGAVLDAAQEGIVFVLAAGNEGDNVSGHSPARANGPNVLTVSAIGQNRCLTSWSNYGAGVDHAAPGSGIISTWKGGGTKTLSGTSMAAPHVAGLALFGNVGSDGTACGDRGAPADPLAHR